MSWVIFALIAVFLWSIVAIIDKFILTNELHNPHLASIVLGLGMLILLPLIALIHGYESISWMARIFGMLAGVAYQLGILFYYTAIKKEEISRIIPVFSLIPVFDAIFAFFFLGEKFGWLTYGGLIILVMGSLLMSLNVKEHKFSLAFFIGVVAALFYAFRDVSIKQSTFIASIWDILFWVGIGGGLTAIILLIIFQPHIKKSMVKGSEHILFNGIIGAIAFLFFTFAISKGPVSLVSGLIYTQPLVVFILATGLSLFHPKILREKLSRPVLIQKSIAIIFILVGSLVIILF